MRGSAEMPRRIRVLSRRPGQPWPGRGEKVAPNQEGDPARAPCSGPRRAIRTGTLTGSGRLPIARFSAIQPQMRELAPGAQVAGYRIEALVGRGGMGLVYQAVQAGLNRVVALKVIAPELL